VQLQAEAEYRSRPQDLADLYVRNRSGEMVPLSGLVTRSFRAGPNVVSRFNGFTSVQVTGAPAPGYSTGQALEALREVAAATLPEGFGYEFSGASLQEVRAGNQAPLVIGLGLVMVFLILAAQFEKWLLPMGVLLAVPVGLAGAYAAVLWRGLSADIFFQIGLLTLVGLAAKNAILIVEFCAVRRAEGKSLTEAAVEAAGQRFRPILMTSFTFILGCVPLAISTGAGAGARVSIGTGVIGGMLAGTLLLIFFVPLFYVVIQGAAEKLGTLRGAKAGSAGTE
jgi:multidrug efflux pump